jgi:hypothetical protein
MPCHMPHFLCRHMIAIASSKEFISFNFCAISDTSVIACIPPAIMATEVASRIEKNQ